MSFYKAPCPHCGMTAPKILKTECRTIFCFCRNCYEAYTYELEYPSLDPEDLEERIFSLEMRLEYLLNKVGSIEDRSADGSSRRA